MKVKTIRLFSILLLTVFLLSFLSYEINLYSYYKYFQIIISILIIFISMLIHKMDKRTISEIYCQIKQQKLMILMFFLMLCSTIFGLLTTEYLSFFSVFSVLLMFVVFIIVFFEIPIILSKNPKIKNKLFDFIIAIVFILAIIALVVDYKSSFLGYSTEFGRARSILIDPNFFGMLLGVAFLMTLLSFKKKNNKLIICCILGYAIFLTGSRGALVSLIVSITAYYLLFSNMKNYKKLFILFLLLIIFYFLLNYLFSTDFFRTHQGSNGRFEMISAAFNRIKDYPLTGFGYTSIGPFLLSTGFKNSSTHNSFVDFVFSYGIITSLIYIVSLLRIILISIKSKNENLLILLFMIINMNTILYNLGGVGISSLLFTLILGILNYKKKGVIYEKN